MELRIPNAPPAAAGVYAGTNQLQPGVSITEGVREHSRRIGEIGFVENVVDLGPEFDVLTLGDREPLVQSKVELAKPVTMQRVSAEVPKLAEERECRGIQEEAPSVVCRNGSIPETTSGRRLLRKAPP